MLSNIAILNNAQQFSAILRNAQICSAMVNIVQQLTPIGLQKDYYTHNGQYILQKANIFPSSSSPVFKELEAPRVAWAPRNAASLLSYWYIFKGGLDISIGVYIGSVSQRATNLLSVKSWEWFKPGRTRTRATHALTARARSSRLFYDTSIFDTY